jgi:hypothetical protein
MDRVNVYVLPPPGDPAVRRVHIPAFQWHSEEHGRPRPNQHPEGLLNHSACERLPPRRSGYRPHTRR